MSSLKPGSLVKEIRARKRLQQYLLSVASGLRADSTLSRVENMREEPTPDTMKALLDGLDTGMEELICPHFEDQPMDVYVLRDRLLHFLDMAEDHPPTRKKAQALLRQFEAMAGFDAGINLQFVLCGKARLYAMERGKTAQHVLALALTGIKLTYPEFDPDCLEDAILIFEEPELLHTLALAYYRAGDTDRALGLLYYIKKGLGRLPEDDLAKEKKRVKTLLTLARLLTEERRYAEALAVMSEGRAVSLKNAQGKHLPDFAYLKAFCLDKLDQRGECESLLYQAYFGHTLLRQWAAAQRVRENAARLFGATLNTYGAEKLAPLYPAPPAEFQRGATPACHSVGELIAGLRADAGMTMRDLCQGVCALSTLFKIESGKTKSPQVSHLEVFMQRLGRDIDLYFTTFLSHLDFTNKQIRDEIISLQANSRFDESEPLIAGLETQAAYKKGVNRQFILAVKATLTARHEGMGSPLYAAALREALAITYPDFDEHRIINYRLSYYEIGILNELAIYYAASGDTPRGLKLWEQLLDNMDDYYADETEKIKMFGVMLYNYSKHLGLSERYKESYAVALKGETLEVKHGRINLLPGFAVNKAYDLLETGKKEESVPYLAQAYYGTVLLGDTEDQHAIGDYAKKRLGIVYD